MRPRARIQVRPPAAPRGFNLLQLAGVMAVMAIGAAVVVPDAIEGWRSRMAERAALDVVRLQDAAKRFYWGTQLSAQDTTSPSPMERRWPGQRLPTSWGDCAAGATSSRNELQTGSRVPAASFVNPWQQPYEVRIIRPPGATSCNLSVTTAVPQNVQRTLMMMLPGAVCSTAASGTDGSGAGGRCAPLGSLAPGFVRCCSLTPRPGKEPLLAYRSADFKSDFVPPSVPTQNRGWGPPSAGNPFGPTCTRNGLTGYPGGRCPDGAPYCAGCESRLWLSRKGNERGFGGWHKLEEKVQCLCGYSNSTCTSPVVSYACDTPQGCTGYTCGSNPTGTPWTCGSPSNGCGQALSCGGCPPTGNPCTRPVCTGNTCTVQNLAAGTSCGADPSPCQQRVCNGAGSCVVHNKPDRSTCSMGSYVCPFGPLAGSTVPIGCRVCMSGSCVADQPHVDDACVPSCGHTATLCNTATSCCGGGCPSGVARANPSHGCRHCCEGFSSSCASSCPPEHSQCGGCFHWSDPNHCGSCDVKCSSGQSCVPRGDGQYWCR